MSTNSSGPETESAVVEATISASPITSARAQAAVEDERHGAVVVFNGVVRNHDGGKGVTALSYTAHPTAGTIIAELTDHVAAGYAGIRIWIGHRTGQLQIGDAALVCAVASAHRHEAFAACSALVERVKAELPIWKEQTFADGTIEWVGI